MTLERSIRRYLIKHYCISAFLIIFFLFFSLAYFWYSGLLDIDQVMAGKGQSAITGYLIIGVIFLIILGYSIGRIYGARNIYYCRFAKANGYNCNIPKESPYDGALFQKEIEQVHAVIFGTINNQSFQIFDYSEKVGDEIILRTILKFKTDISFPKTLFIEKGFMSEEKTDQYFSFSQSIVSLDGGLNNTHLLLCEKGFEIEVLQLFSQEFQFLMSEKYPKLGLEFSDKNIFIHSQEKVEGQEDLSNFISLANHFTENFLPVMKSIENDYIHLKELHGK
ncbi:MAG: hypothetical protein MNSN_06730 [Minisyncoccus archaeiphilus]|uniref:hypothetical protein n=1 Tax=Minisyncoccus archaeiphilus TaxID=3238481 RepID=UPI002B09D95F|nr:MAG: hypothetical protein MNSN_06730 [Candidatus Parcubacteria bacterium]